MRRSLLVWIATAVVAGLATAIVASAAGRLVHLACSVWPLSVTTDPAAATRARLASADDRVRRAAVAVDSAAVLAQQAAARSANAVLVARANRRRVRIASRTTLAVQLTPEASTSTVIVPPPVIERLQSDSVAIVLLQLALAANDSLVSRQRSRMVADSLARAAASTTIDALEQTAHPRCARRCGVVIGVVALLGTAVAMRQVEQFVTRGR